MEYSIKELAALAGVTSRTLRHYDTLGLLRPSRVATNGYRHYDDNCVLRLQRILLLRRTGMSLEVIGRALADNANYLNELRHHEAVLLAQRRALDSMLTTVQQTKTALQEGRTMNAKDALGSFNEQYKDEVIERWGARAYQESTDWFTALQPAERQDFAKQVERLNQDWINLWEAGTEPTDDAAQKLAKRHVEWLCSIPGTPAFGVTARASTASNSPSDATPTGAATDIDGRARLVAYVEGLATMYPADPRFAINYGGERGAEFVRDSLLAFVRS